MAQPGGVPPQLVVPRLVDSDPSTVARLESFTAAPESKVRVKVVTGATTAAIGLGIVLDSTLGIFDVVTAPACRR